MEEIFQDLTFLNYYPLLQKNIAVNCCVLNAKQDRKNKKDGANIIGDLYVIVQKEDECKNEKKNGKKKGNQNEKKKDKRQEKEGEQEQDKQPFCSTVGRWLFQFLLQTREGNNNNNMKGKDMDFEEDESLPPVVVYSCPICCENFYDATEITVLQKCKHVLCKKCLLKSLACKMDTKCTVCRRSFDEICCFWYVDAETFSCFESLEHAVGFCETSRTLSALSTHPPLPKKPIKNGGWFEIFHPDYNVEKKGLEKKKELDKKDQQRHLIKILPKQAEENAAKHMQEEKKTLVNIRDEARATATATATSAIATSAIATATTNQTEEEFRSVTEVDRLS